MNKLKIAERALMAAMVVMLLLLAVSFLPIGDSGSSGGEISLQLIVDADGKISPEVESVIAEAAVSGKEGRINVIVESYSDVSSAVKKSKGKVTGKADVGKLKFSEVEISPDRIERLAENSEVEKIYPTYTYYPTLAESVPLTNAKAFWDAGYKGSGVKVAVLDTGIDKAHPMLAGKVVAERDFSNSGTANDKIGHGTHVAGIIAGTTASGGSYSGIAPEAQLLNARVIGDDEKGSTTSIIEAIDWAVANGADVISMSLGAPTQLDAAMDDAIREAVASGVAVVVSSGNCGKGCPSYRCGAYRGVTSPGSSPSSISVGAVDKNRQAACFSGGDNIEGAGIKPDITAPGVSITSSVPNSGYQAMDGTSMSAPHVSGAVALLLQKNPELSPADVKHVLEATSTDLGPAGKDASYGSGVLDLAGALNFYSELEFKASMASQVTAGSAQRIEVQVFDDVPIIEVRGKVTKPDSTSSEFTFSSTAANAYSYDYTDTSALGNYNAEITVRYQTAPSTESTATGERTASRSQSFRVTLPAGDFGNVEAVRIDEQQFYSKNLTGSIDFKSRAAAELDVSLLLQLIANGSTKQEIRFPPTKAAAGAVTMVKFNWEIEVEPGNYTLLIITDYGAGSLLNETNIKAIDDLPPKILSVSYQKSIRENNPQGITVKLKETARLSNISVSGGSVSGKCDTEACGFAVTQLPAPLSLKYTTKLISETENEKDLSITIFNGLVKDSIHLIELTICDEYSNCAEKAEVRFDVRGCDGKGLLVVKTHEEKSVFEEAAASSSACLSVLDRSTSGTPPASYLERFDAVIMITGTDLININDEDAEALLGYYDKKGRLAVEGSDVAFMHGDDALMTEALHAALKDDIGFTAASLEGLSSLSINATRQHPVTAGLQNPVQFNATRDQFPDSISALNGGVELASWAGLDAGGSAMVAYESDDGTKKSLLMPFDVTALDEASSGRLAANAISWLLEESSIEIMPAGIRYGSRFTVPVEGEPFEMIAAVESNERLNAAPKTEVFADGNKLAASPKSNEGTPKADSKYEFSYQFTIKLSAGEHAIKVAANSDFATKEINYLNNVQEYSLRVYPKEPDLLFSGIAYHYDEDSKRVVIELNVSNMGGTDAETPVKAYLDGSEKDNKGAIIKAGETETLRFELLSEKGTHEFRASADPDNSVTEYNESNNELTEKIYLCSREKVLVVDDNDGLFYSTAKPSSAEEFASLLRDSGYCVEKWDEAEKGTPAPEFTETFQLVVWSAGDYFGNVTNQEDTELLRNYGGSILLEGSDIAMELAEGNEIEAITGSTFSQDLMIEETKLVLKEHPITEGINSITINSEKSPYPDAVDAASGEAVAEWPNGKAAITATEGSRKTAYYGFSVDGIREADAMKKLVENTVQWLLEKPNTPPRIENLTYEDEAEEHSFEAATVPKITMNEGETKNFSIIAMDPDGDELSYTWLLNGTTVSLNQNFSFSPKYNESGDYNITIIVSDGQAETRLGFILTVLDTLECGTGQQRLCGMQLGACSGSVESCTAEGKWPGCTAENYNSDYEAEESSCDAIDNNCDGIVDEGFGDVDEDGIADCVDTDNDNDGVEDEDDDIIGRDNDIGFDGALKDIKIKVGQGENDDKDVKTVRINNSNKPLVEFSYNFSKGKIILRKVSIEKQEEGSGKGYTIVKGLELKGSTKDVFVDRLIASSNAVCVKDEEVSAIAEVTGDCNAQNERLVKCDLQSYEQQQANPLASCQFIKGTSQFKIYGLKHSAVMEQCTDADGDGYLPEGCDSGLDCDDGNSLISPSAAETCNNADDNCNGLIDEDRACNTPPKLQAIGNRTAAENSMIRFTITATDNEADELLYNSTGLPEGASFDNKTAEFAWTPGFNQAGTYVISFRVSDGLLSDSGEANITVANTNRAPVLDALSNVTFKENEMVAVAPTATDPDGDEIYFSFTAPLNENGTWKTTFEDSGTYTANVTASDGSLNDMAEINITVTNVNRPPVIQAVLIEPGGLVMGEGESKSFFATAYDSDEEPVETTWKVNGEVKSTEPVFVFTTDHQGSGDYRIELAVSDSHSTTTTEMLLTVQDTLECGTGQQRLCGMQLGACSDSVERCANGKWPGCSDEDYGTSYGNNELGSELRCDGLDNNCDGTVDENCLNSGWTPVNGKWESENGIFKPSSYGQGGHALAVEHFESLGDTQVRTKVKINEKIPEVGVCGRMSLEGKGYCLSYGWGRTNEIALSYFDGFPYDPIKLKGGPHIRANGNEEFYLKLQLKGSAIKGKVWLVGAPEPDWQVETTTGMPASGSIGYYTYYTNAEFETYTAGPPDDSIEESEACEDSDGDWHRASYCGGLDCNDGNKSIHPDASELCNNIDDNCNGLIDEGCPTTYKDWNIINGNWEQESARVFPTSYGYGGHALIINKTGKVEDALISAKATIRSGTEAGLCGRMSLEGEGYCLSYGWGMRNKSVLSYYNSFPYDPISLKTGPVETIRNGESFFLKLLLNGSYLKGKIWLANEEEPNWQVETTDKRFTSGSAGYYTYYTNASFTELNASRIE